jgi:(2S)-methylsuccinyl-CoA dehydrogenase
MAKLLAARIAWANADNAVQIHGGNGFALKYPVSRVLCDARMLNTSMAARRSGRS